jgi:hypothetical protein
MIKENKPWPGGIYGQRSLFHYADQKVAPIIELRLVTDRCQVKVALHAFAKQRQPILGTLRHVDFRRFP